ncbi:MAG: hypothetical protein COB34_04470 [Methylophilaceae bacterium]|nr:MAG: hypothetical protein COB34_04470 [Methylophilaceae bacterium]
MPYILRGDDQAIQAVSQAEMLSQGWEEIEAGSKEYLAYLEAAIQKEDPFRESDIQLARVLEDLISLLIDRDFIRFTDFPDPAQKRLIERQGLRSSKAELNLLEDDSHF